MAEPETSPWNVPNALTAFRIVLVPVFAWMLLVHPQEPGWRVLTAVIFTVAILTDTLDGYLSLSPTDAPVEAYTHVLFWKGAVSSRLASDAILADHSNYPASVCKHHAPESDLTYGTIGSVVIDVSARTLWACAGNPCRGQWREVRL